VAFVTTPRSGQAKILTFRVTDQPATTCTSGVWKKLLLVDGKIGSDAEPAYSVEGRALSISINANICDANDDINGELAAATFKGDRRAGGMFGSTLIGSVRGSCVQQ